MIPEGSVLFSMLEQFGWKPSVTEQAYGIDQCSILIARKVEGEKF